MMSKRFAYTTMGETEVMEHEEVDSHIISGAVSQERAYGRQTDHWPTLVKVDKLEVGEQMDLSRFTSVRRIV